MDDMLVKFKEVVDEEILAYESMGELYQMKQTILVQGKSDALWDVDALILSKAEDIKALNRKRKDIAKFFGSEDLTMSEIIEKAKSANDEIALKLENQKNKLRVLIKTLTLQEDTNMTLVKHGLTMVGKTLDIIVGVMMPQAEQYNKKGKNIDADKSLISSVVREA